MHEDLWFYMILKNCFRMTIANFNISTYKPLLEQKSDLCLSIILMRTQLKVLCDYNSPHTENAALLQKRICHLS